MLWSKNNLFKRHKNETETERLNRLKQIRIEVATLFQIKDLVMPFYVILAFDYFTKNPNQFDGATIVKDLDDLPNLSISAMIHDYCYLVELPKNNWVMWLINKTIYDWHYAVNLEKLGKGYLIPYTRAIALIAITPIYALIKALKIKI